MILGSDFKIAPKSRPKTKRHLSVWRRHSSIRTPQELHRNKSAVCVCRVGEQVLQSAAVEWVLESSSQPRWSVLVVSRIKSQFPIKWSSRKGHWYLSVCACVRKCRLPFALRECLYVGAGGEKGYY